MLPVLLSTTAAVLLGTGIALQQLAAAAEEEHAAMDPRLIARLFRRKAWLLGLAVSTAGFVFQASAIATGRLVLVEPIAATNVLFALLVSARRTNRRLGAREWRGAALAIVGLGGFLIVASPEEGVGGHEVVPWVVPIVSLALAVGIGLSLMGRIDRDRRGLPLAVLAGLAFGTADALLKLFTDVAEVDGLTGVVHDWGIYAWFLVSTTAFLLQQSAFHVTHLGAAAPASSTLAPTTAAVLGALMFDEQVRGGWAVPFELGFAVAMLYGVVLLASSPLIEVHTEDLDEGPDPAPAASSVP